MKEQTRIAVEWWADRLRAPTFKTLSDEERQADPMQPAAFGEAMMGMLADKHPVTDEQLENFKTALAGVLEGGEPRDGILSVDYGPERILAEAADAAGIDCSRFPIKTVMWLRDGGVRVSLGYGSPHEELLPETAPVDPSREPQPPPAASDTS